VILDWFNNSLAILLGLPMGGIIGLFWFSLLLEWPRYFLTFIPSLILIRREMAKERGAMPNVGKVSILIPGHNEADSIEKCVLSLREQTFPMARQMTPTRS
jgi:hypothetical protein